MDDAEQDHATRSRTTVPTVSACLDDATLIELLHRPQERKTIFALYNAGRWTLQPHVDLGGIRLIPFSPENNLIKNEVVLLPSEPRSYGSEEKLLADVHAFIHRYVDLSPAFEKIATYYILLSWLYD